MAMFFACGVIYKHHIQQAKNIPYQPLFIKYISAYSPTLKNQVFSNLVFQYIDLTRFFKK